jgi:unsaturated rhamnogalacturonyl hydrolase
MSKSLFILLTVVIFTQSPFTGLPQDANQGFSNSAGRDSLVVKVSLASLSMQRKDWEQGVIAQAFLEEGNVEMMIRMVRSSLIYSENDGRLAVLGGSGLIDCAMLGESLWRAAQWTGDPGLSEAEKSLEEYLLHGAARAEDGTLYHAEKQMWVDSHNCSAPYLAVIGHYDEALRQIEGLRRRLWNRDKKMFSHIWDDAAQTFINPNFWGVGNGWAAVGLTRVIRASPEERRSDRDRLVGYLDELLSGCLSAQRPDGLFHNDLDRPETFVETNAAQMFAYAIFTGIRGGWISEEYLPAAERMRRTARGRVDSLGFVQGVCGAPTFDKPGIAAEGQAFFLLMETAAGNLDRP